MIRFPLIVLEQGTNLSPAGTQDATSLDDLAQSRHHHRQKHFHATVWRLPMFDLAEVKDVALGAMRDARILLRLLTAHRRPRKASSVPSSLSVPAVDY
jgi:hypothetical protein